MGRIGTVRGTLNTHFLTLLENNTNCLKFYTYAIKFRDVIIRQRRPTVPGASMVCSTSQEQAATQRKMASSSRGKKMTNVDTVINTMVHRWTPKVHISGSCASFAMHGFMNHAEKLTTISKTTSDTLVMTLH